MIIKKAIVMIATFVPYLPRLPTKNIAIALGERIIETKRDEAPAKRTHREMLDISSNARFTAPPIMIAIIPDTLNITLQNPGELKDEIIKLLYDSSFISG